jgi:hypothetical protein
MKHAGRGALCAGAGLLFQERMWCEPGFNIVPRMDHEDGKALALDTMRECCTTGQRQSAWYWADDRNLNYFLSHWSSKLGTNEAATQKFEDVMNWRDQYGVDLLQKDVVDGRFDHIKKHFDFAAPRGTRNHQGGGVYYERYGPFDANVIASLDEQETLMYVLALCEEFAEECAAAGYKPPTILIDLKGLSLSHLQLLGWCQNWASTKQDNYSFTPGTRTYLCGVSPAITVIWGITKHWLTPEVRDSVRFISVDEMDGLLDEMTPENIPTWCLEQSAALREAISKLPPAPVTAEDATSTKVEHAHSAVVHRINGLRERLDLLRSLEREARLCDNAAGSQERCAAQAAASYSIREEKGRLKNELRALDSPY